MTIGMYYFVPVVAIFYYLGTQHQISVTYYMFVYYFSGNLIFGVALFQTVAMLVDRPIYAAINLTRDVADAEKHEDYKLVEYLDNFRPELQDGPDLARASETYAARLKLAQKAEQVEAAN